jgi:hypothetical protein
MERIGLRRARVSAFICDSLRPLGSGLPVGQ